MGQVWNWRKSLPTIWRPCSNSTINTEGADVKKYHVTVDEDGCISWYKDAEFTVLHRDGAPAFEHVDGGKEWWLNGQQLTEQEHTHRVNPAQEMTVADIEKLLGKRIKIIK